MKNISVERGFQRVTFVNRYIQLLDNSSAVCFLIKFLSETDLDTFSMIILSETLKHYLSLSISDNLKKKIEKLLFKLKKYMLDNEIKIDASYKKNPYMKDYDFSKIMLIERINRLWLTKTCKKVYK